MFLWPHYPQFRFFAPFLIFHFPLHFIWMKFLIFHHSFLSECVLLIQFFWSYSPHLDLDILLFLLLWLRFLENWQHQRPLFSQLLPGFCFLSNSCQPFLCETECIIIIETNSVFKWKGVCGSEGDSWFSSPSWIIYSLCLLQKYNITFWHGYEVEIDMTIEEDGEYEAYEFLLSLKVDCAVMVF